MLKEILSKYSPPDLRWGLALTLAHQDIRDRFTRTVLGPFWIVISNAALVGGIAVVFGGLFNAPIADYVTYVALGIATWTYISTIMTGSSKYFESGKNILFTYDLPWSMQITRRVFVEAIVFGIHLLVAIPIVLYTQTDLGVISLFAIVGYL